MRRRSPSKPAPDPSVTDAALEALNADELRTFIRDMMPWFDDALLARFTSEVVDRAARNASEWTPQSPADNLVDEIEGFAEAAKRIGYAEPWEVDAYLREGSSAFLSKRYPGAVKIFEALLIPIARAEIDLGQHEMVEEVLGVDPADCAAQYVVSVYMTSPTKERGESVLSAIDAVHGMGRMWEPLRELERVALEPLPELDAFLSQWRRLVQTRVENQRRSDWDSETDRWLREVVRRTEGISGLADVARASRRTGDLQAWCRALVEAGDWSAALEAHIEAAELVQNNEHVRGHLLDGAALAAQELGRGDLAKHLEHAWRQAPSMVRLRRWLGTATTKKDIDVLVAEACAACPKDANRQQALLHVLGEEFVAAAHLLRNAPGLDWSRREHPGHLLFPLFVGLLGTGDVEEWFVEEDESEAPLARLRDPDAPQLGTPPLVVLLEVAGVAQPDDLATRSKIFSALRCAAEQRLVGVTENKRRRHYGHAALLAIACARVDGSPEGGAWLARLRDRYRRFSALQREFKAIGGRRQP
ncbi:MAG: hypothetical protein AAGA48_18345 [Myxococcota bacterium]